MGFFYSNGLNFRGSSPYKLSRNQIPPSLPDLLINSGLGMIGNIRDAISMQLIRMPSVY